MALLIGLSLLFGQLDGHLNRLVVFAVIVSIAKTVLFHLWLPFLAPTWPATPTHSPLELPLLVLQHHAQRLSLQVLIALFHYLLELFEVVDQQDLLDNLPLILICLCFLTSLKKLLLAYAYIFQE